MGFHLEDEDPGDVPGEEDIFSNDPAGPFYYLRARIAEDRAKLRRWMSEHKYFPSVWFVSDHGNPHPITDLYRARRPRPGGGSRTDRRPVRWRRERRPR